ncbi:hypothetical protein HPG69_008705, partial [Diceros bicornis minor]
IRRCPTFQKQHPTKITVTYERIKVKQQLLMLDKTKFPVSDHANKSEPIKRTRHLSVYKNDKDEDRFLYMLYAIEKTL